MTTLWLDLESFSETPLAHGTYRYAETAEVMLIAHALDDGPVEVIDMTERKSSVPEVMAILLAGVDEVVTHGSFDPIVLDHQGVHIPIEKHVNTMVLALEHGLLGSLDKLCDILKVPFDKAKDKAGKKLINLFCKPRPKNVKLRRATRETHPEKWQEFVAYAALDIHAMRDVHRRLPRWNTGAVETALWQLDRRINDRGIAVDVDLAHAAIRAFERSSRLTSAAAAELTSGAVTSVTQVGSLKTYLDEQHGFKPIDLTKGTVAQYLRAPTLDPQVRELLELRQQGAAASPAKYKALLRAMSRDGRLRGTIQFCGAARTRRDAGRIFQPQNLPRPTLKRKQIEAGIAAMKANCEDLLYDNVPELCMNAIRGCMVAPPGRKLVVADLSNIEGRVAAWLAGEHWKIKAFNAYDRNEGPDLYIVAYARSFSISEAEVLEDYEHGVGNMRQVGKVMELAFQFGGAVGAFATMGLVYGVELPEDEVVILVKRWRRAHPAIVRTWYAIEDAVKFVLRNPDKLAKVGMIGFDVKDGYLRIRLPGGDYLSYKNAALSDGEIIYEGVNQYTRQWTILRTYGGKLFENIVQATARDVMMWGLRKAEAAGYEVVLRVHDELMTEVEDDPRFTAGELADIMSSRAAWMLGLPLAAKGLELQRYGKD